MSKTHQVQAGTFNKSEENQTGHKSAFQMLKEAQEKFEQEKQAAILQVRQLVEDWAIDLKKDVFPELVKPRKPYTRKAKAEQPTAEQDPQQGQKQSQEAPKVEAEGVATSVDA